MGFSHGFRWSPEKLEEIRKLHVEERLTHQQIAERLGLSKMQVDRAFQRMKSASTQDAPNPLRPGIGEVTLEKVRERFDIKAAIYRELEALPRGTLLVESELCQRVAGNSTLDRARFQRVVENNEAEFRSRRMRMRLRRDGDEKWYWGHEDDIAAAVAIRDS
jgi:hypothetical protein